MIATTLEFRFFGPFAIRGGDSWHGGPPPKKGREFIQYLGIYPRRAASREDIATAFWPSIDSGDCNHRIHLAASGARVFLRKLLGGIDAIRCSNNVYVWNPEIATESDVNRFMAHCRRGTIDGYRDAISLYAGDFLAGETADWLQPMRVRLAAARSSALECLTQDALLRRDYAAALSFGLELLEAERGHEGAARQVMQAFAGLDQRTRVLDQYLMLRRYLAEQIGVEPTEETTALVRRLVGPVNLVWSAPSMAQELQARDAASF